MKVATASSFLQTIPGPVLVLLVFIAYFALLFISTKFITFVVRRSSKSSR